MLMCWRASTPMKMLLGLALSGASGGCVYYQKGPPTVHFEEFSTKPPKGDTVTVCHAYGCKMQTPFTLSQEDVQEIGLLMTSAKRHDSRQRNAAPSLTLLAGWNGALRRQLAPRGIARGCNLPLRASRVSRSRKWHCRRTFSYSNGTP